MKTTVLLIGECMAEFSPTADRMYYQQAFAGDVYNTAVYLQRCAGEAADTAFMSAIGDDLLSQNFKSQLTAENISTRHLFEVSNATMGAYMVHLDNSGERSFSYWRKYSAATQLMDLVDKDKTIDEQYVFFSGISFAILSPADRETLFSYLAGLRDAGKILVFDPNYRPRLWSDVTEARDCFKQLLSITSIALPGLEDFQTLFQLNSSNEVADMLEQHGVSEYVIKDGTQPMLVGEQGQRQQITVDKVSQVVDSTSAGDGFNGGYLSQRIKGFGPKEAAEYAAKVSACVIQHPGAIVEASAFSPVIEQLNKESIQ